MVNKDRQTFQRKVKILIEQAKAHVLPTINKMPSFNWMSSHLFNTTDRQPHCYQKLADHSKSGKTISWYTHIGEFLSIKFATELQEIKVELLVET